MGQRFTTAGSGGSDEYQPRLSGGDTTQSSLGWFSYVEMNRSLFGDGTHEVDITTYAAAISEQDDVPDFFSEPPDGYEDAYAAIKDTEHNYTPSEEFIQHEGGDWTHSVTQTELQNAMGVIYRNQMASAAQAPRDPKIAAEASELITETKTHPESNSPAKLQIKRQSGALFINEGFAGDSTTAHHEFGHAVHASQGFSSRIPFDNWDNYYVPEENNFPLSPPDDTSVDEATFSFKEWMATNEEPDEKFSKLTDATNDVWEDLQETAIDSPEELEGKLPTPYSRHANYAATQSAEVFAHFHEVLQAEDLPDTPANWFYNHHDFTTAYMDVFEPSDGIKQIANHLHETEPDHSPFDAEPFPDVDVDPSLIHSWEEAVDQKRNAPNTPDYTGKLALAPEDAVDEIEKYKVPFDPEQRD